MGKKVQGWDILWGGPIVTPSYFKRGGQALRSTGSPHDGAMAAGGFDLFLDSTPHLILFCEVFQTCLAHFKTCRVTGKTYQKHFRSYSIWLHSVFCTSNRVCIWSSVSFWCYDQLEPQEGSLRSFTASIFPSDETISKAAYLLLLNTHF